mgnify:CR=1 FL=1
MESRTCRDVHIDVSMRHTVHAPQDRHGVKHDMLQVDGEVQQQDREGDCQHGWNRADRMEQTPIPLLGITAMPTAVSGSAMRMRRVLSATRVTFVGHRQRRTTDRARRGISASPPARSRKAVRNTASLMAGSYLTTSTGQSIRGTFA